MWMYLAHGFVWGALIGGLGSMCVIAGYGYMAYGWGDYAGLTVMSWGSVGAMIGGFLGPAIGFFIWSANSHGRSRRGGMPSRQRWVED